MEKQRVKYPIGIQSFHEIRTHGYLYVDKTQYIHDLITQGKYYFLSRPRRFGKSLLLSTIEALFLGRRELFDGLYIAGTDLEWEERPVFHIDLNVQGYERPDALMERLDQSLKKYEDKYALLPSTENPALRFEQLITEAHRQSNHRVVILIDEYDKPLLTKFGDEQGMEIYRDTLSAFYSVLKSLDQHIRFGMLTGVTRFGKLSVFSSLNNLRDISLEDRYAGICGITQAELEDNFSEGINGMAQEYGISGEEMMIKLKKNYDGYHFSQNLLDVYNPFSLLNAFASGKIGKYWFETATPTFLVNLLKTHHYELDSIDGAVCSEMQLKASDQFRGNPIPMFYQTGYLTIKAYDRRFNEYTLGFPNEEVEEGFLKFLLPYYTSQRLGDSGLLNDIVRDAESGHPDDLMRHLKTFFDDFPYDQIPNLEVHYQNIIYIVAKLIGMHIQSEYKTCAGRIDLVISTDNYIYIIECKLKGTARTALKQINDNGYAHPFATSGKTIIKIGVAFDRNRRTIRNWAIE